MAPKKTDSFPTELHAAVRTLADKKAEAITVLDLGEASSISRYFIIATATSEPHLNALRSALDETWAKEFSTATYKAHLTSDAKAGSGWFVVDGGWVMIHLFTAAQRARYRLEDLWGDAEVLKISGEAPSAKKPAAAKSPAKTAPKAVKKLSKVAKK